MSMFGACIDSFTERLVIGAVTFPNPAMIPEDAGQFNALIFAAQRGDDTILPTSTAIANPRYETVTEHEMSWTCLGFTDFAGTPYTDERAGLALNIAILEGLQIVGGDGTQAIGVIDAAGVSRSGLAHVSFTADALQAPGAQFVTLRMSFPAGKVS